MPHTLPQNPIGTPFVELQSVDSTNNYARRLIGDGMAQHGTALFAHEQLAGKGQRGKTWTTEKGANIILSIIIKPYPLELSQQFHLVACAGLAVHDFFKKYAGDPTRIKWPNDLYWQDRKAGGILIENVVGGWQLSPTSYRDDSQQSGIWQWAVVGIGININQTSFPSEIQNPVSLKQITGKNFDVIALGKELCMLFKTRYDQLLTNGFNVIYDRYINQLYKRNQIVKLRKDSRAFEALIKGVSSTGQLIIQHTIEERFDFGEIEWIIE